MKIGIISIAKKIEYPELIDFDILWEKNIGLNSGNLLFTNAIYRQIQGDLFKIGFDFDADDVNNFFDTLIIPAANWLNNHSDWTWLIAKLEKVEIPIITIGIGLQSDFLNCNNLVNESSMKLITLLSQKSKYISCRGDFTRNWLHSAGFQNIVTTGCPSLYMKMNINHNCINNDFNSSIILQGTRYWLTNEFIDYDRINRPIYYLAGLFKFPMIYQSEPEEMDYIINSPLNKDKYTIPKLDLLTALYGCSSTDEIKLYLSTKGSVFFDVDKWSLYIQHHIGVIGSRLHGSILALNSGKPCLFVTHDSRTLEIADFANIPTVEVSSLVGLTERELESKLVNSNVDAFHEKNNLNKLIYKQFLLDSGLKFHLF